MARTLYVASTNPGKLRDFAVAAAAHDTRILPLPGLAAIEPPAEDAPTFEDMPGRRRSITAGFCPARSCWRMTPDWKSTRSRAPLASAPPATPPMPASRPMPRPMATTISSYCRNSPHVPESERGARYQCVLAAARDGAALLTAQGTVEGRILSAPRGSNGFGYDPLFYLPARACTMAEMDDQTKWTLSHRGHRFSRLTGTTGLIRLLGQIGLVPGARPNLDAASIAHQ